MNWLWFIAGLAVGFLSIRYSKWLADNTTRIEFAEKLFGPTGTYLFWKLVGVFLIVFGFYALFNF